MNEFSLINHFFKRQALDRDDVVYGIGDDAACVRVPHGMDLFISTDTLNADVHFHSDWDPSDIAYKAVMVNISDIAAMAAEPCWLSLALSMPSYDESWLKKFSKGLHAALKQFGIALIGGDTTSGPLSMTISIHGLAPKNRGVTRSGARASDIIWLTGPLGAAAYALSLLRDKDTMEQKIKKKDGQLLIDKLQHPLPRVDFRTLLQEYATSAIDISDGLTQDLNHICEASKLGARLSIEAIPIHPLVLEYQAEPEIALDLALHGGDDYELCFTTPAASLETFRQAFQQQKLSCFPIGIMEEGRGLRAVDKRGIIKPLKAKGYRHF